MFNAAHSVVLWGCKSQKNLKYKHSSLVNHQFQLHSWCIFQWLPFLLLTIIIHENCLGKKWWYFFKFHPLKWWNKMHWIPKARFGIQEGSPPWPAVENPGARQSNLCMGTSNGGHWVHRCCHVATDPKENTRVFPKIGGFNPPKWMVKIMENPIKNGMIWGYHYFWKHPHRKCPVKPGEVRIWVVATQIFLEFSPRKLGKMNPFWRAYFSKGLVQSPTRDVKIFIFFASYFFWEVGLGGGVGNTYSHRQNYRKKTKW